MSNEAALPQRDPELLGLLAQCGEHLTQAVAETIVNRGSAAIPGLIEIVEDDDLGACDAPGAGFAPLHAVTILRRMRSTDAVSPMLRVLGRCDSMEFLYSRLIHALKGFGAPVLEQALREYEVAESEDQRAALADVLSGLGVRDDRIFAILLQTLAADPVLGAGLLVEYGDPAAVSPLQKALDGYELNRRGGLLANQEVFELEAAIKDLGGTLTDAQNEKVREAERIQDDDRATLLAIAGRTDLTPLEVRALPTRQAWARKADARKKKLRRLKKDSQRRNRR